MNRQLSPEPGFTKPVTGSKAEGSRWAVVLAGGEGVRLRPLIEMRFGEAKPKQFCAFWGGKTMLQWALERAHAVCPWHRVKPVITARHERFIEPLSLPHRGIELIRQPADRGSLAGLLLPLSHILEADPDATVAVLPSDHFADPESRFSAYLGHALKLAEQSEDQLVLLGAVPDRADAGYEWIKRESCVGAACHSRLASSVDRPSDSAAYRLFQNHWLWNTGAFAVKGKLLWRFAGETRPDVVEHFDAYRDVVRAVREGRVFRREQEAALEETYRQVPWGHLSRDLIQQVPLNCSVLPLEGVYWADCGSPERLARVLRQYRNVFADTQDPNSFVTLRNYASVVSGKLA